MRILAFFFVSLVLLACSQENGASSAIVVEFSDDDLEGKVHVKAQNANALLGTNDPSAKSSSVQIQPLPHRPCR